MQSLPLQRPRCTSVLTLRRRLNDMEMARMAKDGLETIIVERKPAICRQVASLAFGNCRLRVSVCLPVVIQSRCRGQLGPVGKSHRCSGRATCSKVPGQSASADRTTNDVHLVGAWWTRLCLLCLRPTLPPLQEGSESHRYCNTPEDEYDAWGRCLLPLPLILSLQENLACSVGIPDPPGSAPMDSPTHDCLTSSKTSSR